MAKKTKLKSSGTSFDGGMDLPDFDFDVEEPKNDRNPAVKGAKAILSGAKDGVINSSYISRALRDIMPPEYGEAVDIKDEVAVNIRKLYNDAGRTIKPALNEFAKAAEKAVPAKNARTKKFLGKLDEMSKDTSTKYKSEDQDEANLNIEMARVFGAVAKNDEENRLVDKSEDRIRDSLAHLRHKDSFGQLAGANQSLSTLVQYQNKINAPYQRKSLELQFRSLAALQAIAKINAESAALNKANLEAIIKNTALPEFVKIKKSERLSEMMRNKFLDQATEGLFGGSRQFIGKMFKNIGNKAQSMAENFASGLSMGAQGIEAGQMAGEMGGITGQSKSQMLLGAAGGMGAQYLGSKAGKWGYDKLSKNAKFAGGLKDGTNYVRNWRQKLVGASKVQDYGEAPWKQFARSLLGEAIGDIGPDTGLQKDNYMSLRAGGTANQTNKSVNEIIPGYLARILREIQITRTGDTSQALIKYDYTTNKFADTSTLKGNISKSLIGDDDIAYAQTTNNAFLDMVDPKKKLPNKVRKALVKQLTSDNMNLREGSIKNLTDITHYHKNRDLADSANQISDLFSSYFGADASGDIPNNPEAKQKRNELTSMYNSLGNGVSDPRAKIQEMINLGMTDELEELGFIKTTNGGSSVDLEAIFGMYANGRPKGGSVSSRARKTSKRSAGQMSSSVEQDADNSLSQLTESINSLRSKLDGSASGGSLGQPSGDLSSVITAASSKDQVEETNKILTRLEELIANIEINRISVDGVIASKEDLLKGYQYGKGKFKNAITAIKQHLVDPALELGKGITGLGRKALGNVGSAANKALGLGKAGINAIAGHVIPFRDVFFSGELIPRMTAAKMKAGEYRDQATGEIIKRWKDIKGTIIDSSGQVVLSHDEVKDAFVKQVKNGIIPLITLIGTSIISFAKKAASYATEKVGQIFAGSNVFARKAYGVLKRTVVGILDAPKDIYVKGEESPRLLAIIMKAGGYFSLATKSPITRPSQIDGPVLDRENNQVLTEADLKVGLVDSFGNPIVGPWTKLLQVGAAMIGKGLRLATTIGKAFKDGLNISLGAAGGAIGKFFEAFSVSFGGKKTLGVLESIRDILDARLPGKRTKFNDRDGDGVRDGSWKSRSKDKKNKDGSLADPTKKDSTVKPDRENTLDLMQRKMSETKDKILDFFGFGDDDDGIDLPDGKRKRKGRLGKRIGGRLGRFRTGASLARGALGLGRLAMGGIGLGGLFGGGVAGASTVAAGTAAAGATAATSAGAAAAAAGAATTGAAAATAGTAAVAGGGVLGAIGTGLAAIGGIVSSPVVLGALALGGAMYGAYKLNKYLTRPNLDPLSKYRMQQYGFTSKDVDWCGTVQQFEKEMLKVIKFNDGAASLSPDAFSKDFDFRRALKLFGNDPDNEKQATKWLMWFNKRFKPVFLTHVSALKNMESKETVLTINNLALKDKLFYFNATRFENGPYDEMISPFGEAKLVPAGRRMVMATAALVEKEIKEKQEKDGAGSSFEAGLASSALLGGAPDSSNEGTAGASNASAESKAGAKEKSFISKVTDTVAILVKGAAKFLWDHSYVGLVTSTFVSVASGITKFLGMGVTASEAVRFKAYGLVGTDRDKVIALRELEEDAAKYLKAGPTGVTWNGSVTGCMKKYGKSFGLVTLSGYNDNLIEDWVNWFTKRFIVVFLEYCSLLKAATGKFKPEEGEKLIKPDQLKNIANRLVALDIWAVTSSPWKDYKINTDPLSTKENVEYLNKNTSQAKLSEQKASSSGSIAPPSVSSPTANTKTAVASLNLDKDGKPGLPGISSTKSTSPSNSVAPPTANVNDEMKSVNPGDGTIYSKVPPKKGSRGLDALRDTVTHAARLVGVPTSLALSTVAVESNFDPEARPWSKKEGRFLSSATGLYQFIKSTWDQMISKYGKRYGIPEGTPPTDERANAILGAQFIKDNMSTMKRVKNASEINETDVYMAHFLGAGGASKFFSADPSALAASVLPEAAASNPSIFYNNENRNSPRTVSEVYSLLGSRVSRKLASVGLKPGGDNQMFAKGSYGSSIGKSSSGPTPPATTDPIQASNNTPSDSGMVRASYTPTTYSPTPKTVEPSYVRNEPLSSTQRENINNNGGLSSIVKIFEANNKVQVDQLEELKKISGFLAPEVTVSNMIKAFTAMKDGTPPPRVEAPRGTPPQPKFPVPMSNQTRKTT